MIYSVSGEHPGYEGVSAEKTERIPTILSEIFSSFLIETIQIGFLGHEKDTFVFSLSEVRPENPYSYSV